MEKPNDPTLYLAEKVGELSGVITTFQGAVTDKLDSMQKTIDTRVTRPECELIVSDAIAEHKKEDHRKASVAPGLTLRLGNIDFKKIGLIIGAAGLGGSGIWSIIQNVLEKI